MVVITYPCPFLQKQGWPQCIAGYFVITYTLETPPECCESQICRDHFVYAPSPANKRQSYNVLSSLIAWVHTQNDPWIYGVLAVFMVWAYFSNDFCIIFHQIRWNIAGFSVTQLQGMISLQKFAQDTTEQLSCHMQNFIAITSLQLGWEQNEISIDFKLWWQNLSWNGPLVYVLHGFHGSWHVIMRLCCP